MSFLCSLALFASWSLTQSANFEVYSQGGSANAQASLIWFEQLKSFFAQAGLGVQGRAPVRVIGFASEKEYDAYRLHQTSDAYYVGTGTRDYIVMPSLDRSRFGMAAHEYAHLVLHAADIHLPSWLNEGIAEVFSTVRLSDSRCEFGGDIWAHSQLLRLRGWMPLSQLLTIRPDSIASRSQNSLFYAQSWALTEMLLASPEYSEHFPELISALRSGKSSALALSEIYSKSLDAITSDMRKRLTSVARSMSAPGLAPENFKSTSSALSPLAAECVLAELLLASDELNRAEVMYRDLARDSPGNPEISAALGTIALRRGDKTGAQLYWKQALAKGIADPVLCYRYAVLAGDAGVAEEEIRPALERAIELKPDFDDARFQLALIESNSGHYGGALQQLAAMREIPPSRGFSYWLTTAYAEDQLAMHAESKLAAQKALGFAATEGERTQATELAYVADTELTVQFTRDPHGNPQMTTTRVARGTQTWNPFVEPQDQMHRARGRLRAVECGANEQITGFAVETAEGALKLTIPDPQHVLIRGENEFTCGAQASRFVTVDYAASPNKPPGEGVLRGMEVLPK